MILDTTYLLPLAGIEIDRDLLKALLEGRARLKMEEIVVSLISIFELQAKAAKLNVKVKVVNRAINAIVDSFKVVPFHDPEVVKTSFELRKHITDYVDCILLATAIVLKDNLVTEDSLILKNKKFIQKRYGTRVFTYSDFSDR